LKELKMSKTLKLVKTSVSTYTDKDGKTKHRYRVIGKVIDLGNGGQMLSIDLLPFNWDGTAFLNDPEEQGSRSDDVGF
jgi:hypothetical protein